MTRRDLHRDALVRELGVTQYQSGYGKATAADESRALDSTEGHPLEHSVHGHARGEGKQHHDRWQHRVRDVMTTPVVSVNRQTRYKQIAALLARHQISAVPVLVLGRHVAGVVSEADLLSAQEKRLREAQLEPGGHFHRHADVTRHWGLTAGELMTSPAITTHPDAPLSSARRLMSSRHIKRLPVVEAGTVFGGGVGGKLVGIVSRCDLLSVFLRPDEDIAGEVREMLAQLLHTDPDGVTVQVRNGIATLAGTLGSAEQHDLIRVAGRLTWDIDGVVDVVNNLGTAEPTTSSTPRHGSMLPRPGELVASAYDFTEQLLTSQRKFAEDIIEVTKPLLGGTGGAAANKDDTK